MVDLKPMDLELQRLQDIVYKKLDALILKHSDSDASQELIPVMIKAQKLLADCRDHLVMKLNQNSFSDATSIVAEAQEMEQTLDDFEEKFLKYNIPKRGESMPFEEYKEKLRAFMEIWRKEAEKGREKGQRSLIELVRELGEERASTFEEMKSAAIELGTSVARHLDMYFWIIAFANEIETVMTSLEEVESVLECFAFEGEKSVFLERFLEVLKQTKLMINLESVRESYEKIGMVDRERMRGSMESEKLRMVLQEILRVQVAFCCPDLPKILTDEMFLSIGTHLKKVFEKKVDKMGSEMTELLLQYRQSMADQEDKLDLVFKMVDDRIVEIWKRVQM